MDSDEIDLICAEAHLRSDPTAQLRAMVRLLQNCYMATYGGNWLQHWEQDTHYQPPPAPEPSFAGEHLSWEGRGALEVCRIIAGNHPGASKTAIAREAARVLGARPPQREVVEVDWRAERMPRFADPATNTVTTRVTPDRLTWLRQQIEAQYGPIGLWQKHVVQEADPATFAPDPNRIDEGLLKAIKRLLNQHELGHQDFSAMSQTVSKPSH
jgi:hypothetical protein